MTPVVADPGTRATAEVAARSRSVRRAFRRDIQGLRALAVGLVVVYHVWPSVLPGGYVGVDVFFVISGFLITGHLLEDRDTSRRALARFWARRIRRLLPAALTVLVVSLVAVAVLLPDIVWVQNAREGLAAAFYVENVVLAQDAVNYLREGGPASVVQHYWSLSVEEQFYLLWPVLLLGVARLAAHLRRPRRVLAARVIAVTTVLSFGLSIYLMNDSPSAAYFATFGRMWEFGVGALLATAAQRGPRAAMSARTRGVLLSILGGVGLVAVTAAAVILSSATAFPGWPALLPVAGAALVVAAHDTSRRAPHDRLLGTRPLQAVGDLSYSLYLWHWPVVVVASRLAGEALGAATGVGVIALSIALARLTKHHVEDRFRTASRHAPLRSTYRRAVAGMAVVSVVAGALLLLADRRAEAMRVELTERVASGDACFGAASLSRGTGCPSAATVSVVPAPIIAQEDRTRLYDDGCWENPPFTGTTSCSYGDPDAPISIALVGNSHAGHWFAAVEAIAAERGAHVTTFLAAGCTVTSVRLTWETDEQADGCLAWGRRVVEETSSRRYDLIITSEIATRAVEGSSSSTRQKDLENGYVGVLRAWEAAGRQVLVIRDSPRVPAQLGSGPECVAANPTRLSACRGARGQWLKPDALVAAARSVGSDSIHVVDLTSSFCTSQCSAVVGGVLLFYDNHHLTDTFVRTLVPHLRQPVLDAIDRAVRHGRTQGQGR